MRLLAILVLGAGLAWWFLLRPAAEPAHSPSAGNYPAQAVQTSQAQASPKAAHSPAAKPSPPADASSLVKRPINRAREAIDANQKRLENEL